MAELRRFVFVFVGPNVLPTKEGECDLAQALVRFAKRVLDCQLESTMNLPLTTKVKIDTVEGSNMNDQTK